MEAMSAPNDTERYSYDTSLELIKDTSQHIYGHEPLNDTQHEVAAVRTIENHSDHLQFSAAVDYISTNVKDKTDASIAKWRAAHAMIKTFEDPGDIPADGVIARNVERTSAAVSVAKEIVDTYDEQGEEHRLVHGFGILRDLYSNPYAQLTPESAEQGTQTIERVVEHLKDRGYPAINFGFDRHRNLIGCVLWLSENLPDGINIDTEPLIENVVEYCVSDINTDLNYFDNSTQYLLGKLLADQYSVAQQG